MEQNWITVNEASYLTEKSEPTIRRWISEHKLDQDATKKINGKTYINSEILSNFYTFVNDKEMTNINEETKHKKEAMQIAYNSEIIRSKDEYLKAKDRQIELLINKKSYLAFYITVSFIALIIVLGGLGYIYRSELINTYNLKIESITANHQKEVLLLSQNISELKIELKETKIAYTQTLKAVDLLHLKYNEKINELNNLITQNDQKYNSELLAKDKLIQTKEMQYQIQKESDILKIKQLQDYLNLITSEINTKNKDLSIKIKDDTKVPPLEPVSTSTLDEGWKPY